MPAPIRMVCWVHKAKETQENNGRIFERRETVNICESLNRLNFRTGLCDIIVLALSSLDVFCRNKLEIYLGGSRNDGENEQKLPFYKFRYWKSLA